MFKLFIYLLLFLLISIIVFTFALYVIDMLNALDNLNYKHPIPSKE